MRQRGQAGGSLSVTLRLSLEGRGFTTRGSLRASCRSGRPASSPTPAALTALDSKPRSSFRPPSGPSVSPDRNHSTLATTGHGKRNSTITTTNQTLSLSMLSRASPAPLPASSRSPSRCQQPDPPIPHGGWERGIGLLAPGATNDSPVPRLRPGPVVSRACDQSNRPHVDAVRRVVPDDSSRRQLSSWFGIHIRHSDLVFS